MHHGYGEKRLACCSILNTETSNRNKFDSPPGQPLVNPLFSFILTGMTQKLQAHLMLNLEALQIASLAFHFS